MSKLKRIGILGGTFDPIHNAHLACAEAVLDFFQLETVKFIPCANTPHREQPLRSTKDRCKMVQLAIDYNVHFELDQRECSREGLSFTIDTLRSIKAELGKQSTLFFILGLDAFQNITHWKEYKHLLEYCHLVVMQRPNFSEKFSEELETFIKNNRCDEKTRLMKHTHGCIYFLQGPMMDISATQIRSYFDFNTSNIGHNISALSNQLPEAVKHYIHQNGLYQERNY